MTPADILAKLFPPVTKARLTKAQGMAIRGKVGWADVVAAMTPEQRGYVEYAQNQPLPVVEYVYGFRKPESPIEPVSPNQFVEAYTGVPLVEVEPIPDEVPQPDDNL